MKVSAPWPTIAFERDPPAVPVMLGDITLLVVILYLLEALLLLTHALRHRAGLFPVCMVLAILVFFMRITDPFSPKMLGPGGMILSVNSLTIP